MSAAVLKPVQFHEHGRQRGIQNYASSVEDSEESLRGALVGFTLTL
jgi:hypothetical protein